jgi:hypothetical protein
MSRTQAEKLLQELSGRLDGPAIELDAEGLARLTLGDQPLAFLWAEELETLASLVVLGLMPGPSAERRSLTRDLMRANCLWRETDGGTFGLDEDSGLVFLQKRWFLTPPPAPKKFLSALARQLHLARPWRERFLAAPKIQAPLPNYAFRV